MTKGVEKPVTIDGTVYPSISAASIALEISKFQVLRRIQSPLELYKNWRFLDKEKQDCITPTNGSVELWKKSKTGWTVRIIKIKQEC